MLYNHGVNSMAFQSVLDWYESGKSFYNYVGHTRAAESDLRDLVTYAAVALPIAEYYRKNP